jgi:hypothetical protein
MKKTGKKAFVIGIVRLVGFAIAVVLLFFLIKNSWNVGEAFNDMLSLLRLK